MTFSRIDGISVALNCLLISLLALLVFEVYPFGKVEAGTLAVSSTRPAETEIPVCNPSTPLPTAVSDYVAYTSQCLLHDDSVTLLDGDVLMMFHRLNEVRRDHDLPDLKWHSGAAEVARLHAIDMVKRGYFAHQTPEGLKSSDRLRRIDRDEVFGVTGENLAYYGAGWPDDYTSTRLQQQLEGSPSHFKAMINSDFTHAGAAIVRRGNIYMAVQVFLASEGQLPQQWPMVISPGDVFDLPDRVGQRAVGGWRLVTPDNRVVAKAYDKKVRVPATATDRLRLVVLGEDSPSAFILLNAPAADLKPSLSH